MKGWVCVVPVLHEHGKHIIPLLLQKIRCNRRVHAAGKAHAYFDFALVHNSSAKIMIFHRLHN